METNSLSHHGILGMHWGVKNGPPYPLSRSAHSISEKKAGWQRSLESVTGIKINRKKNGVQVSRSTGGSASSGGDNKLSDEDRQKIIRSGNAKAVEYFKYELSDADMQQAVQRIQWQREIDKAFKEQNPSTLDLVNKYAKSEKAIADVIKNGAQIITAMNELKGDKSKGSDKKDDQQKKQDNKPKQDDQPKQKQQSEQPKQTEQKQTTNEADERIKSYFARDVDDFIRKNTRGVKK